MAVGTEKEKITNRPGVGDPQNKDPKKNKPKFGMSVGRSVPNVRKEEPEEDMNIPEDDVQANMPDGENGSGSIL